MNSYDKQLRPHPVNVGHLVMGVAFACLVGVWALIEAGAVSDGDVRWLLPLPWLAAGGVGLAASVVRAARPRERSAPDPADQ